MNRVTAALALLATLAVAAPVAAAGDAVVAVGGEPRLQALVRANAEAALRSSGFEVAPAPGVDEADLVACVARQESCAALLADVDSHWVVALAIEAGDDDAGEPQVVVTGHLLASDGGERLQVDRRYCERCSSDERLAELVGDLVAALVDAESAREAPETYLEVHTDPAGATLLIDGQAVGITGRAYRVAPGRVQVELRKAGFAAVRREIRIGANETQQLRVEMAPVAEPGGSGRRLLGWTAIGTGTAAALGGVAWLIADGSRVEDGERLPERNQTRALGIGAAAVGAGLITAGVFLLATSPSTDEVSISAVPSPDGVGFAIGGTF